MHQTPSVALVAGLGGLFTVVNVACAQPWGATTAPARPWQALAVSADGMKAVAAGFAGGYAVWPPAPIYVSTDRGVTWTETSAPSNRWSSVACSADGTKLVAASGMAWLYQPSVGYQWSVGAIYRSPDAGANWIRTSAPSNSWTSVASSADGTNLLAAAVPVWDWKTTNYVGEGAIYRSSDSGATWTRTSAPSNSWSSVASSADGFKFVAVAAPARHWETTNYIGEGAIYRSFDSGATWTRTSAPSNDWSSVASSVDGSRLVAAGRGNAGIYTSTDSGVTWTLTTTTNYNDWSSVASSADGTKLVAASWSEIYTSTNSGTTWAAMGAPRGDDWTAVACSADGNNLLVASGGLEGNFGPAGGQICILPYSGPWRLAEAPKKNWSSVASSADGTKLLVAAAGSWWDGNWILGAIYRSLDSGSTWTQTTAPTNHWTSVASSADGTKLVAVSEPQWDWTLQSYVSDGVIEVSPDAGASWTRTSAPSKSWTSVASSADGTNLVAVAAPVWDWKSYNYLGEGAIYRSLDSGATWKRTSAPTNRWSSVASSADGARLVAASFQNSGGDGLIYTSGDPGGSWTRTSAPTNNWQSVASSRDGTKLVAAASFNLGIINWKWSDPLGDGLIYTSTNSGATWTPTTAPSNNWVSVSSSADGTKLVAVAEYANGIWGRGETNAWWVGGPACIYTSTNSGATWERSDSPAVLDWSGVASSADGSLVVAVGREAIYVLQSPAPAPPRPPSPRLLIDRSGDDLGLSWLVPSTRFVLQQSADLRTANWVDVPTAPTLDFTRLHYRVTLTPSLSNSFYRLKQQ